MSQLSYITFLMFDTSCVDIIVFVTNVAKYTSFTRQFSHIQKGYAVKPV